MKPIFCLLILFFMENLSFFIMKILSRLPMTRGSGLEWQGAVVSDADEPGS
jgi:hypothetical protein